MERFSFPSLATHGFIDNFIGENIAQEIKIGVVDLNKLTKLQINKYSHLNEIPKNKTVDVQWHFFKPYVRKKNSETFSIDFKINIDKLF